MLIQNKNTRSSQVSLSNLEQKLKKINSKGWDQALVPTCTEPVTHDEASAPSTGTGMKVVQQTLAEA